MHILNFNEYTEKNIKKIEETFDNFLSDSQKEEVLLRVYNKETDSNIANVFMTRKKAELIRDAINGGFAKANVM